MASAVRAARSLTPFSTPRSVAVVGTCEADAKWGLAVVEALGADCTRPTM